MGKITSHRIIECERSRWIRPVTLEYVEDGVTKRYDILKPEDAVVVLVHDVAAGCLVMVRQLRPAVFVHDERGGEERGHTLELCAGLLDKSHQDARQTALRELFEETGYRVAPERLEYVGYTRAAVGISGQKLFLFYVEVSDADRAGAGGGVAEEGENINVRAVPYDDALKLLAPSPTMETSIVTELMLLWFFAHFGDAIGCSLHRLRSQDPVARAERAWSRSHPPSPAEPAEPAESAAAACPSRSLRLGAALVAVGAVLGFVLGRACARR